jgi:hypothetical protein
MSPSRTPSRRPGRAPSPGPTPPGRTALSRGAAPSGAPGRVRRSARTAGALALTLALAGGAAGCGSDEGGDPTTSAGGSGPATSATTTATTGTAATAPPSGGAPAATEDAIRAALDRSGASLKAARTARIRLRTKTTGLSTTATGTIDLAAGRFLLEQTLGDGSDSTRFENYAEDDKVYIRLPGAGDDWSVTDNPAAATDPLSQVRQLRKATITRVGGTKEYDGATCREFDATMRLADVLGAFDDPSVKGFLAQAPKDASVPVTACVDDRGLSYASESAYDLKDVLGDAAASLPSGESSSTVLVTDYGTAPAPKRPAGIDDAKPLSGGSSSPLTAPTP